jgi:hypothetical protein
MEPWTVLEVRCERSQKWTNRKQLIYRLEPWTAQRYGMGKTPIGNSHVKVGTQDSPEVRRRIIPEWTNRKQPIEKLEPWAAPR